jgi:hypothetical protein
MVEASAPVTAAFRNVLRCTGLIILLAACACSAPATAVHTVVQTDAAPRIDVTVALPSGHARDTARYEHAATTTLKILGAWLVPFPDPSVAVTADRTPWWTAPASMAEEYAVARPLSRRYWERLMDLRALPAPFVDALVEYSARRSVSKIVDERYLAVYRGRAEARYFGGFVPRDLRAQMTLDSGGDRMLRTLETLERWTGRPVFDAILLEFVRASTGARPVLGDLTRVASRVSGQDLAWLLDAAAGPGRFDYAVEKLESRPAAGGLFHTTVTVRRLGDAIIERPIPVETTFADGESVRERWDGRTLRETFEYQSPSRAVSADVDPDRILLLDEQRGNNGVSLDPGPARTAANRWSARWMIWLEDALLTYIAFT